MKDVGADCFYLCQRNVIAFQLHLLTAKHCGPLDRYFKCILDLVDKMMKKLATMCC